MNSMRMRAIGVAALVAFPYGAALAQQANIELKQIFAIKQMMSIEELPDDFMAVKLSPWPTEAYGPIGFAFASSFESLEGGGSAFARLYDALWTKGDLTQVGSVSYLVTYGFDIAQLSAYTQGREVGRLPILRLRLVKLEYVQSIQPCADLSPSELKKMFVPKDASQVTGSQQQALSNVKQLALGMVMYSTDYDDVMPYVQATKSLQRIVGPYLKNDKLWLTQNPNTSRFLLNMSVAGVNTTDVPDIANTVMFYESATWPDGRRIVAFMDTHAKILTEEEWLKVKPSLNLKLRRSAKPLPANYGIGGGP